MGHKHGDIALGDMHGGKKNHQADGRYNVRIHNGKIIHIQNRFFQYPSLLGQTDGRQCPQDGRNHGRQNRNADRYIHRTHNLTVIHQLFIPSHGKSREMGQ